LVSLLAGFCQIRCAAPSAALDAICARRTSVAAPANVDETRIEKAELCCRASLGSAHARRNERFTLRDLQRLEPRDLFLDAVHAERARALLALGACDRRLRDIDRRAPLRQESRYGGRRGLSDTSDPPNREDSRDALGNRHERTEIAFDADEATIEPIDGTDDTGGAIARHFEQLAEIVAESL
jgi:hypothetical protein